MTDKNKGYLITEQTGRLIVRTAKTVFGEPVDVTRKKSRAVGRGSYSKTPWQLRAVRLNETECAVNMRTGVLYTSTSQGVPYARTVDMSEVIITETNEFWLHTTVEAVALGAYQYVWKVTEAVMVNGPTLPDPMTDVDLADPINGFGFVDFHIGTVTLSAGVFTPTNQITGSHIVIFPMGILLGPLTCSLIP